MKIPAIITGLILVCGVAHAQKGLHAGLKGAPQSTWMFNGDDSDNANWEYVPTFRSSFGANFAWFFSDAVGLGVDVIYSNQGQRYEFNEAELFTKTSYLKIPVLFHYHSGFDGTAFFYLNAGPQIAILSSATAETNLPIIGPVGLDASENYSALNIGAVLALGSGFHLSDFLQLTVGIRLDAGFTDAEDKSAPFFDTQPNRPSTYNVTGGLEIGVRYVLRTN